MAEEQKNKRCGLHILALEVRAMAPLQVQELKNQNRKVKEDAMDKYIEKVKEDKMDTWMGRNNSGRWCVYASALSLVPPSEVPCLVACRLSLSGTVTLSPTPFPPPKRNFLSS